MSAVVLRGDARSLPLPDASVDLIVTSPPYFGLRSYTDGGEHYAGQIGSEATAAEFVAALLDCTREWVRVLKPSGSLFVNLGDKYAGGDGRNNNGTGASTLGHHKGGGGPHAEKLSAATPKRARTPGQPKSLMGLPWRYALACIDQLGLILRAEIVWAKPNCLSGGTMVYAKVKGRPTTIKVHDLCRAYAPEQVQLWNGQRWTQVLWWQPAGRHPEAAESMKAIRAARRRGDEPVVAGDVEIELRSGERIGCTREHRWPTQRGLVQAADLTAGDVLDTCPIPEGETAPAALDDEMIGWFVGLYIAEGSHGSDRTIQIAGHVKEIGRYKRLRELAEAFHGTSAVYATGGNGATVNLTGRFLNAIIDTYVGGRTAKDKHLRPACWQRSNRFLHAVLDGYLSGDGCWRKDSRQWVLKFTDNDALAADLRTLGGRLGLSVRLARCTHTGFGQEWPGWRGTIAERQQRRRPDSEIVGIRQSRARQFWDIGVEDEPHLFALASGVLTHNSLPESVTDRVRRSHEQVFHFTRLPRYFAAVDEIRETYSENKPWGAAQKGPSKPSLATAVLRGSDPGQQQNGLGKNKERIENPLGKLPGSVWTIPSAPLTVPPHLGIDHFAAFPPALVRPIILGWSPSGICTGCDEGRRPVAVVDYTKPIPGNDLNGRRSGNGDATWSFHVRREAQRTITGYACSCAPYTDHPGIGESSGQHYSDRPGEGIRAGGYPNTGAGWGGKQGLGDRPKTGPWREYHFGRWTPPPTRPAVVLDPFGGTGTTSLVADMLGRTGISVDRSADYCRIAQWRTTDPAERARALGVPKPPPVPDGQTALFEAS